MTDKKPRPHLKNQRYERGYNVLSCRLKEWTGPSGPTYSWPVDDESGPSTFGEILRPSRLTIWARGPTNSGVNAAMN
jgi:hypothetical protein